MDLASSGRRGLKAAVRIASSSAIRAIGVDATAHLPRRHCVVVAAHPDDETLGCGATIAHMRSLGTDVRVVFVTGGGDSPAPQPMSRDELIELRRGEAGEALALLGVPRSAITFWDFPDGAVADHVAEVADALAELLTASAPAQVIATSIHDRHPDHVAVGVAVATAVDRVAPALSVLEFPLWQRVPAWTAGRQIARRSPAAGATANRPQLVRTGEFASVKRTAIGAYRSQLPHFPPGFVRDFEQRYETFWVPDTASTRRP